MSLTDIELPHLFLTTSSHNLAAGFYQPALAASTQYDRGVGFFSSGWLKMVSHGLARFAANHGRARLITSPILDAHDWEALQQGSAGDSELLLQRALLRNVAELAQQLEKETLSALAWMVADGILTFKLAVPQAELAGGDFHDKIGIFTDASGNRLAFNGSPNESIRGFLNSESIAIYPSWYGETTESYVTGIANYFESLWHNENSNIRVYSLPEAAKESILRLREGTRPYSLPAWLKANELKEPPPLYQTPKPHLPAQISLRPYQEEAIEAWFQNNNRGLFEMATGTGKTITALAASVRLHDQKGRLAVIIAVPYQHLVDQWAKDVVLFGYMPILAYQNKKQWLDELNDQILQFNGRYRTTMCVITTHTTFITEHFQESIARLNNPTLIIADEAHHLGAERSRQNYPPHIPFRLGLSATPNRWFDEEGTAALTDYFGETVFRFTLQQAIGKTLTPYYYYPHLVELTDEEMESYIELSLKIARLSQQDDPDIQNALQMLLIKRVNLLNRASNKIEVLADLLDKVPEIRHTLFYCAPKQIDEVMRLVGWEKGIFIDRFTAEETAKERQRLLADFAAGELHALAAMKCLDEGVDVPSTRTAYFLASSSNPREFIQRRGRILRQHPNKQFSIIHDLIAMPPLGRIDDLSAFQSERGIVRRELQRFKEFAESAINKHEAIDVIWELAKRYDLLDF
jgi:DNA phosphorothioation system restriction enzyme